MRSIVPVFALLLCMSCGNNSKVPKGVLPKEKMQAVLWDMIQADEFLKDYVYNKDSTLNDTLLGRQVYEKVFALNKTSRQEFDSSYNYYRRHPLTMKTILDSLASKKQAALPPPSYLNEIKKDSTPALIDTLKMLRGRKKDKRIVQ